MTDITDDERTRAAPVLAAIRECLNHHLHDPDVCPIVERACMWMWYDGRVVALEDLAARLRELEA